MFRGVRVAPSPWDWTGSFGHSVQLIVCFECQYLILPIPFLLRLIFSHVFYTLFTLGLSSLASNYLFFLPFFPLPTYFTHQTHMMEPPSTFFFLCPPKQSCDGTVCPDHVGLVLFSQIYPTMTNLPISVRGNATSPHERYINARFAAGSMTRGNLSPVLFGGRRGSAKLSQSGLRAKFFHINLQ
jgi:hypothetical protein